MDENNQSSPQPRMSNGGMGGPQPMKSKTKAVVAVVVVLLLIGGAAAMLLLRSSDDSSTTPSQNNGDQKTDLSTQTDVIEVFVTEDGFSPDTLRVDVGSTVRWTNRGNSPHIVASNPHPEHTEVTGLDSKDPVGPNGYYEFTFTENGTFGYHDHLNPLNSGEVIVE